MNAGLHPECGGGLRSAAATDRARRRVAGVALADGPRCEPDSKACDQAGRPAVGCRSPSGSPPALLGLAHLDRDRGGAGLLIPRCRCVHTFGMRFALDVVFLDPAGRRSAALRRCPPAGSCSSAERTRCSSCPARVRWRRTPCPASLGPDRRRAPPRPQSGRPAPCPSPRARTGSGATSTGRSARRSRRASASADRPAGSGPATISGRVPIAVRQQARRSGRRTSASPVHGSVRAPGLERPE